MVISSDRLGDGSLMSHCRVFLRNKDAKKDKAKEIITMTAALKDLLNQGVLESLLSKSRARDFTCCSVVMSLTFLN